MPHTAPLEGGAVPPPCVHHRLPHRVHHALTKRLRLVDEGDQRHPLVIIRPDGVPEPLVGAGTGWSIKHSIYHLLLILIIIIITYFVLFITYHCLSKDAEASVISNQQRERGHYVVFPTVPPPPGKTPIVIPSSGPADDCGRSWVEGHWEAIFRQKHANSETVEECMPPHSETKFCKHLLMLHSPEQWTIATGHPDVFGRLWMAEDSC